MTHALEKAPDAGAREVGLSCSARGRVLEAARGPLDAPPGLPILRA